MAKLAAWSIEEGSGNNSADLAVPKRVGRSSIGLEKLLEGWIVKDVSMIGEGLALVGQQVVIDNGRLDLLAIDSQNRLVVIEVKEGMLCSGALHQALDYAASLARLDVQELREKLEDNLALFGDEQLISQRLEAHLSDEDEQRETAVMLVGVGIDPSLERLKEFLGRFEIPIRIVSFEVFKPNDNIKLLVREVLEEPDEPPPPKRKFTVEAVRTMAKEFGVDEQFDRFVRMSEEADLAVQPLKIALRIAPRQNRTRFLMYAQPYTDAKGPGLGIQVGGAAFVEFFPGIDEGEATKIGMDGRYEKLSGKELSRRLDQIEDFLNKLPSPSADDA